MKETQKIINTEIRPYLNSHNGDIEIISLENGILTIKLLGACTSCLLSEETLNDFIKEKLLNSPKIKDVVLYTGVSEEMLELARKILNKNE